MTKLAIVGSRSFNDYDKAKAIIDEVIAENPTINEIVSGGANGADKLAERYAQENNLKIKIFYPEWSKYGKRAGFIRNEKIWQYADLGIAFWDGKSRGTQHSFDLANKLGKKIIIVR